jgi:hypothetical protein
MLVIKAGDPQLAQDKDTWWSQLLFACRQCGQEQMAQARNELVIVRDTQTGSAIGASCVCLMCSTVNTIMRSVVKDRVDG